MKVIILGAGQGKRLLPMTAEIPKALLEIGGSTLLGRQVEAFAAAGVREFVVVTGYAADQMEAACSTIATQTGLVVRTLFNPFFAVADNLASCWMVRSEMTGDFIQANGDNLFRADLARLLVSPTSASVSVAINHKALYDADDMKVMLDGDHLSEIGKGLPVEAVDAEAIGFYVFRGRGGAAYVDELERSMRDPAALKQWFPSAIGRLAKREPVSTIAADGLTWAEVDFPADLQRARQLVAHWEKE